MMLYKMFLTNALMIQHVLNVREKEKSSFCNWKREMQSQKSIAQIFFSVTKMWDLLDAALCYFIEKQIFEICRNFVVSINTKTLIIRSYGRFNS